MEDPAANMSVLGVRPPNPLNVGSERLAEEFRDFRQSWEIFVLAAEIGNKPDLVKVAVLKNFLGLAAVKVLNTLVAEAEQVTPAAILTALEGYCLPQTNETYERFVFNSARQSDKEDINQFVSRLRKLAESCNFGNLKDSLIRDRIVIGIQSDEARKVLLKTRNLTLVDAIDVCRSQKLVENRMAAMCVKEEPVEAETSSEVIAKVRMGSARAEKWLCKYCGRKDHKWGDRDSCPANNAKCRSCGKLNHFAAVCRTKKNDEEEKERKVSQGRQK